MGAAREALRWLPGIALAAIATMAGLEIYLRIHPVPEVRDTGGGEQPTDAPKASEPGERPRAHQVLQAAGDAGIRVNALGLRGPLPPRPKPAGRTRLLVLGDSITYGFPYPLPVVFTGRMQQELAAKGRAVDVVNAGVMNVGLMEEVDLFEKTAPVLEPDAVLVAFYLNDSRPPWGFSRELGKRGWLRRHSRLADLVYTNVALRRYLERMGPGTVEWVQARNTLPWKSDPEAFRKLRLLAVRDWGAAWEEETWGLVDAQLARLRDGCRARHLPLAIAAFPVNFQVEASYVEDAPQRNLEERARKLGIPCLDLLPMLRAHAAEPLYYDQCHMVEHGHALVGHALADFVVAQHVVPDAP